MLLLTLLMDIELLNVFLHRLTLLLQLLRTLIFVEVILGELACDIGTECFTVIHLFITNNTTWSLSFDYVGNVLDTLIV